MLTAHYNVGRIRTIRCVWNDDEVLVRIPLLWEKVSFIIKWMF